MCVCVCVCVCVYKTRLASNEIFSPSNKIHREVGRAKDLSAPRYSRCVFVYLYVGSAAFTYPSISAYTRFLKSYMKFRAGGGFTV